MKTNRNEDHSVVDRNQNHSVAIVDRNENGKNENYSVVDRHRFLGMVDTSMLDLTHVKIWNVAFRSCEFSFRSCG